MCCGLCALGSASHFETDIVQDAHLDSTVDASVKTLASNVRKHSGVNIEDIE